MHPQQNVPVNYKVDTLQTENTDTFPASTAPEESQLGSAC